MHFTIQSPQWAVPYSSSSNSFFNEKESRVGVRLEGAPSQVACSSQSRVVPLGREEDSSDFSVTPEGSDIQQDARIKEVPSMCALTFM